MPRFPRQELLEGQRLAGRQQCREHARGHAVLDVFQVRGKTLHQPRRRRRVTLSGGGVVGVTVGEFQQQGAHDLVADARAPARLAGEQVQLDLQPRAGLRQRQAHRTHRVGLTRRRRAQVDDDGQFPFVVQPERVEQFGFRVLPERADAAAHRTVAGVDHELVRAAETVRHDVERTRPGQRAQRQQNTYAHRQRARPVFDQGKEKKRHGFRAGP